MLSCDILQSEDFHARLNGEKNKVHEFWRSVLKYLDDHKNELVVAMQYERS